jgi:hypothetical protein
MNTLTATVGTGVIVLAGRAAQGKEWKGEWITRTAIGVGVVAIGLAMLSEVNQVFAEQLGALILVAAIFYWGIPLGNTIRKAVS